MYFHLINNWSAIVTCVFFLIKLKNTFEYKTKLKWIEKIISICLWGLLSVFVMLQPINYEGMIFDLRAVPIFYITLNQGLICGISASIFPIIYRIFIGGFTVLEGIYLGILSAVFFATVYRIIEKKFFENQNQILPIFKWSSYIVIYLIFKGSFEIILLKIDWNLAILNFIFNYLGILSIIILFNDANKNILIKKNLEFLSNYDPLTQIYNRRYFFDRLENLLRIREHTKEKIYFIIFDIDNFKLVNDTYGHDNGDETLKVVSKTVLETIRKTDILGRIGGEEFGVILNGLRTKEQAYKVANKIRIAVCEAQIEYVGNVTISLGMEVFREEYTLQDFYRNTDRALYRAKRTGKNKVIIYDEKLDKEL